MHLLIDTVLCNMQANYNDAHLTGRTSRPRVPSRASARVPIESVGTRGPIQTGFTLAVVYY